MKERERRLHIYCYLAYLNYELQENMFRAPIVMTNTSKKALDHLCNVQER